jgi:hypothetical protein
MRLYLLGSQDERIVLYASHYLGGYQGSNRVPFSNLGSKVLCLVYAPEWYEKQDIL